LTSNCEIFPLLANSLVFFFYGWILSCIFPWVWYGVLGMHAEDKIWYI
jgi:hypothetical protein